MAMRLKEFANAEEQLGLLRTIIDKTWTAIADEAAEQKKQNLPHLVCTCACVIFSDGVRKYLKRPDYGFY